MEDSLRARVALAASVVVGVLPELPPQDVPKDSGVDIGLSEALQHNKFDAFSVAKVITESSARIEMCVAGCFVATGDRA